MLGIGLREACRHRNEVCIEVVPLKPGRAQRDGGGKGSARRPPCPPHAVPVLPVAESPLWPKEKVDVIEVDEGAPLSLQCNPPPGLPSPVIFWMSSCESGKPKPLLPSVTPPAGFTYPNYV